MKITKLSLILLILLGTGMTLWAQDDNEPGLEPDEAVETAQADDGIVDDEAGTEPTGESTTTSDDGIMDDESDTATPNPAEPEGDSGDDDLLMEDDEGSSVNANTAPNNTATDGDIVGDDDIVDDTPAPGAGKKNKKKAKGKQYYMNQSNQDPKQDYFVFEKGPANKIGNLYFAYARWRFRYYHTPVMMKVLQELDKKPDHGVLIAGHTDHHGTYKQNLKLSYRRAASVKWGMELYGLDPERAKIAAFSEKYQIYPNAKSNKKRYYNRRVTFTIMPLSKLFPPPKDYYVK